MEKTIRLAEGKDLDKIQAFLGDLDKSGIEKGVEYYLIVEDNKGEIIGTSGIQTFEKIGLLRSLVLTNASAEEILYLLQQTIQLAKDKELERLYCMINNKNAIQLFTLLGFKEIVKAELPVVLKTSDVVKNISTVNNPIFMYYSIGNVDN
ncbi:MAG: hypothetical protein ABF649_06015 [Bacillus sp. (in: firmicutes)]